MDVLKTMEEKAFWGHDFLTWLWFVSEAEGGVAILNWDDVRVRAMAAKTKARIFNYSAEAEAGFANDEIDLWASDIEGRTPIRAHPNRPPIANRRLK